MTFLAFGNGAPDLFSALAAYAKIKAGEAGLQVGGLLGKHIVTQWLTSSMVLTQMLTSVLVLPGVVTRYLK